MNRFEIDRAGDKNQSWIVRNEKKAVAIAILSASVILILAVFLFMYPIEPVVYNDIGAIIPSKEYINLDSIERELSDHPSFYFTAVSTYRFERLGPYLLIKLFLEDPVKEDLEEINEMMAMELSHDDLSLIGRYYTRRSMEDISILALKYANQEVQYTSIPTVQVTFDQFETGKVFQPGDQIISVDGYPIGQTSDFIMYRDELQIEEGTESVFQIVRDGQEQEIKVTYTETDAEGHYMLGIYIADIREFSSGFDPTQLVLLGEGFEGDSAGLMLVLELIQELTGESLTKGYTIAGSGAIDAETEMVYEVGYMDMKVKTADLYDVDYFFVPKYVPIEGYPEYTFEESSEYIAQAMVDQLGSSIQIIPVGTVEEALQFLETLSPRE